MSQMLQLFPGWVQGVARGYCMAKCSPAGRDVYLGTRGTGGPSRYGTEPRVGREGRCAAVWEHSFVLR